MTSRQRVFAIGWVGAVIAICYWISAPKRPKEEGTFKVVSGKNFVGAIVPSEIAEKWNKSLPYWGKDGLKGFMFQESQGFWTPSATDIYRAEACIAATGAEVKLIEGKGPDGLTRMGYIGEFEDNANHRSRFKCQYIGIIVDGKKRIFCNYFPNLIEHYYWKSDLVWVCDGGYSYWRIQYDLESDTCIMFDSNGGA